MQTVFIDPSVAAPPCFAAIDFETADHGRDSACAVALVRVVGDEIVERSQWLIRPPRRMFLFSHVHGITWQHVANQPTFAELWPCIEEKLRGVDYLAAHNASFDRSVLRACCEQARLRIPELRFECTVRLARVAWGLYPTKLPDVCRHLKLALKHHDALSDAEACARIVLAARGRRA